MDGHPRRRQSTTLVEKLNGGKLRVERRNGSPRLYASAYLQGKNIVKSTGEDTPNAARTAAFRWYLEQLARIKRGEHLHGRLFAESANAFLKHADDVGEVSAGQRRNYRQKWDLLDEYFDGVKVADVDSAFLTKLRQNRADNVKADGVKRKGKPPGNATIKKDMDFVRLVLRHALEWERCIERIPQSPSFRGRTWKVVPNRRPCLEKAEWDKVKRLAKRRALEPDLNPRTRNQRWELYTFMMLCVGAALRVDEAYSLRWCDCQLKKLGDGTPAVVLKVFGKHTESSSEREDGYALYDGVLGFKKLQELRLNAEPDEKLFREQHRDGMRELLNVAGLRMNADGISRDSKSLRQTGITLRLEEGPSPDYRDIAKWARTSVVQVAQYYDQAHPEKSVERITGFRDKPKAGSPEAIRRQMQKEEMEDPSEPWERAMENDLEAQQQAEGYDEQGHDKDDGGNAPGVTDRAARKNLAKLTRKSRNKR